MRLLGLIVTIVLAVCVAPTPSAAEEPSRPARKLDVWYVPTPHEIVDRMLDVARVRPGDVVYDLGCGDGRMVIAAAKKFGTRGVGVDLAMTNFRVGRTLAVDPKKEMIVDDPEAAAMLTRNYRAPYVVPDEV